MNRSRRSLTVLGACGLIIGLIALSSSSAVHAEKGANWMVNGKAVTKELTPEVAIFKLATSDMTLKTEVLKIKVTLLCKGAEFLAAKLEPEGVVGGKNTTKFTGCETKLNGATAPECAPHDKAGVMGTVTSEQLKGELILNEGQGIILFQPVTGEIFLALELGTGECPVNGNCPIIGKNSVKDAEGLLGKELAAHTVEQGPVSELWAVSKTAEHKATVEGQAVLELSGAHKGLKWSGVPG